MAKVLRDWLPEVIQEIEPWVSIEDIAKGKRWSAEISGELDATGQGLICVTRTNQHEPWLNFEAGALAKSLTASQVRPVLLDVQPHEVTGPLAEFQATVAGDEEDMFRLVESLNAVCEKPLRNDLLRKAYDRAWPDLNEQLGLVRQAAAAAEASQSKSPAKRTPTGTQDRGIEDMFGEILDRIRAMEREMRQPPVPTESRTPSPSGRSKVQGFRSGSVRERSVARHFLESLPAESRPDNVTVQGDALILNYSGRGMSDKEVTELFPELEVLGLSGVIIRELSDTGHVTQERRFFRTDTDEA